MRKHLKRWCSLLLALVMVVSLLPAAVFADDSAVKTYAKVTSEAELTTGQYVLVTDTGYAPGALDGTWVTAITPSVVEGKIENPTEGVWTLTVSKDGVVMTDANGVSIAPKGGNTNGIKSGNYAWAVSFANGKFTFAGTGDDTVTFASNKSSANKFRGYKNSTVSGNQSGYPSEFTLYKLSAAQAQEKVATPTASVANNAEIEAGTAITFTCDTDGAAIYYKTVGTDYQAYTGPITPAHSETYTVKATKDGMTDSDELTVSVKVYELVDKYVKADAIDTGDQVVIYNVGNGYAVAGEMKGSYYLAPVSATVAENALTADSFDTLAWTVTKNEDGTYTFVQGDKTLTMGTNDGKFNLNLTGTGATAWDVETCNAENASYYMSGNGVTGNYGKVYMEYYAKYTEFSAYCTSTDRLTEKDFGMTFYKLTQEKSYIDGTTPAEKVATPTASPAPGKVDKDTKVTFSCATEGATISYATDGTNFTVGTEATVTENVTFTVKATKDGMTDSDAATFAYTVKTETPTALFKDGEKVVIYNPANMKALSTTYNGFYNNGTDVTLTNGKLTGYTDADVWTVGVNADGTYTFSTSEGKKLSMDTSYTSTPLDKANTAWNVTAAATTGCYYIQNTVRGNYLEWYADKGNWSSYNKISDEALFAQAFYRVRESGIVTSLSDGDTVVVFNPANMKALSTTYNGFYNNGTDVALADGKLTGYTKADIWTVGVNADGTYTFSTSEGKKLSMDTGYTSTPLDKANTAWNVMPAATENCFYIQNTVRGNYLEWYADKGNWSSYSKIGDEALFAQQFYLVVDDGGSDVPSGNLPAVGDKVVIYNQNAQAVLAGQDDNTDSPSIEKALAEIVDDKAVPENGAVVFTVEKDGDYYRFHNETYGYLCSNGTGNNAFYSATASEDADWTIRECSGGVGGYEMEHRTAKYSGHSQWLEYYNDSFKTYSMYNVTDYTIYSFYFYPVADDVKVDGGLVVKPTITFPETMLPAYVGSDYEFELAIDTIYAIDDPWLEYSVKKADGTYIPGYLSELQGNTDVEVLDGFTTGKGRVHITVFDTDIEEAAKAGDTMTLTFSFKDIKGNVAKASYTVKILNVPVISNLTPAQNTQTEENKRPTISADIANAGENASVTMTVNSEAVDATYANGKVSYTPAADFADGSKVTVTVRVKRADGAETTVTWSFTVGTAKYQLYFGQLHSHTQYSDGSGTLDSALSYIGDLPESANIDFVAFTDHSNYFDSKNNPNVEAALYDTSLVKDSDVNHSWATYKKTVADFNAKHSDLIALAGFEMTWSGGPGHINTFNTPGIVSRNNTTLNNKTDDAGMKAYYALLSQQEGVDSISQFNHPGTTFGTFKDFSYWDPVIDSRMYMVEVGNGEGQIGAGGYYPSYSEYIKALDKGWHLAPTNNQDNHKGKWGNANDARDVILTDDFSEEGIYAAIRAMRMYATEDKNLEIRYTVNGMELGSIISDVPEKLDFDISFYDPDASDSIAKVELVANSGKVAYTWDDAAALKSGSVKVTLDPTYSYYFVRITQGDGDIAVTAPVWVGESLKLGISSVECGTSTPVTNEALTITTTLFNSEKTDASIKSVSYTMNGAELTGDKAGATAVPASGTAAVTFAYTPATARVMTVTVTVVLTLNGEDYTFTKDITLDVLDASKLVYIGIDASHYNEYVAGNYKDSMGNFGTLAAQYSVRTVELKTSEELIAACGSDKYKAIILTAPSRRLEAAQKDPKTYSEAELNALKTFNDKGGMVILAGWSDNYENYDAIQNNPAIKHMAATQNEVLAALGSSLRISDDATYDDERSAADGVDKWRLYFSTYNMDNPLLDGVIVDAEHPYDKLYTERFSHYGGASIYAVDESGTPTSTLPATVSPAVYGHATTYSVDVDKDGLGGAGIPKYTYAENDDRLLVMATERSGSKGMVVVSGAAFMSNFEVQAQLDNGAEKNYSNYRICENLLKLINPTEITPIATVQAQPEEGIKYTIEGIVTSNASGYDKDTAFFDCIYVQDETAGINAFPVAGDFKIGDKVRITGTTSSYQGERQIAVGSITKRGEETPVTPKRVTAAQLENKGELGSLVTVEGTATKIEYANGLIQTIMVKDASGKEARIFIDGYITTSKTIENAVVGCHVVATGLASYDNTFVLEDGTAVAQRIRIRDRADVVCTAGETPVKTYNITYVTDGGTINGDYPATYTEGTVTVLPTNVTKDGCTFLGWFTAAEGGDKVTQIEATETGDKTFYAHWQKNETPAKRWSVTLHTDGGKINSGNVTSYTEGTVTVLPTDVTKTGCTFLGWFTAAEGGSKVARIEATDTGDKVFYAHWQKNSLPAPITPGVIGAITGGSTVKLPFNDVSVSDWFYNDVRYVYENGIMDGTSANSFAPNAPLTRAMIVTILYRMEKSPAVSGTSSFTDVAAGKWYAKPVAWAAANGIVNGYGSGLFGPSDPVTREQLAAILYRYTAYRKASTTVNGDNLASFTDLNTVSGYALESMNWAVGNSLLKGANGKLDPKANATRAQVAAIIHRYLER